MLILKPLMRTFVIFLALLSVSRCLLIAWQAERVFATDGLFFILYQGIRFDILTLCLLLIIPSIITPYFSVDKRLYSYWSPFLKIYFCATLVLLLFMELSTPNFITQFDARPNIIFTEYLKYPKEILSTLWGAYKASLLLAVVLIPASAFLMWRALGQAEFQRIKFWQAPLISFALLFIFALGIRSSLDHRPANPSIVAFSTDLMVNDLVLNSSYSMLYALYESKRDERGNFAYGQLPETAIINQVRSTMAVAVSDFIEGDMPTLHEQNATYPRKNPFNIVIILEESLGAEFVGRFGGPPITPNIDKLSTEGIWFEHLYATGTRSVRGIEAVISGFTPTPARSVVKLNKSQRNFFTIAGLLKEQGYDTSFIYGGEAHFDNMQRFFMNNGFNSVIGEHDYPDPIFTGSWGVSDEDLFYKAHEQFSAYGDKPFFSLVFSSSNHSPFEFPDDSITLHDEEKETVNNAVKYADYSLGKFFELAKNSNYWENTIFLIVADHNSRVRGVNLVPIEYFHIPGLILGGSIVPSIIDRIASQIDLLPTLLSLAGVSSKHPAIGYDLTSPDIDEFPGRAMMQYNTTLAYMQEEDVVIFEKYKLPQQYIYHDQHYTPAVPSDGKLIEKALAHSLFGPYLYNNGLYYLP